MYSWGVESSAESWVTRSSPKDSPFRDRAALKLQDDCSPPPEAQRETVTVKLPFQANTRLSVSQSPSTCSVPATLL